MDIPMRNSSGPSTLPESASEQAIPARIGRAVPLMRLSPSAASGPISAVLVESMLSGSMSLSTTRRSSIAAETPMGMEATMGWVRNICI